MEWYPFYPLDFERDTAHLTLEQEAVYRRLIDWYMIHGGAPADDDRALANIARIPFETWAGMAEVIRAFFVSTGTRLKHGRCEHELNVQTQQRRKNAKHKKAQRAAKLLKKLKTGDGGLSENVPKMSSDKTRQDKTVIYAADDARARDPRWGEVYAKLEALLNLPAPLDGSRIHAWLASGADPDLDIYPTVERLLAKRNGTGPPNSLAYFDRAIADALISRTRPQPTGHAKPAKDDRYAAIRSAVAEFSAFCRDEGDDGPPSPGAVLVLPATKRS